MAAWEHQPCGKVVHQKRPPFRCDYCWMLKPRFTGGWVHRGESPKKLREQAKRGKGSISQLRREQVYARDGNACVNCGSTSDLTLDHKIPRSRGGTNDPANLQTMCEPCNVQKANKLPNFDKSDIAEVYVLPVGRSPNLGLVR